MLVMINTQVVSFFKSVHLLSILIHCTPLGSVEMAAIWPVCVSWHTLMCLLQHSTKMPYSPLPSCLHLLGEALVNI